MSEIHISLYPCPRRHARLLFQLLLFFSCRHHVICRHKEVSEEPLCICAPCYTNPACPYEQQQQQYQPQVTYQQQQQTQCPPGCVPEPVRHCPPGCVPDPSYTPAEQQHQYQQQQQPQFYQPFSQQSYQQQY